MNSIKLSLEALVLFIHLVTGAFVGYLNSINETQAEITTSILVSTTAMFLLWGMARLQGKYLLFEIESILHGAIAGGILAFSQITMNAMTEEISINPVIYWVAGISTGLAIGII
jgi:hypothetical protein